jgi:hypothetical protein
MAPCTACSNCLTCCCGVPEGAVTPCVATGGRHPRPLLLRQHADDGHHDQQTQPRKSLASLPSQSEPVHPARQFSFVVVAGGVDRLHLRMRLRPVLVQFQLARPALDSSSKAMMPASILCWNSSPSRATAARTAARGRRSVSSAGRPCRPGLPPAAPALAMHGQVDPAGHALQIGIDLRRLVGVRSHEGHQSARPRLQVAPVRVGPGAMSQQHEAALRALEVQAAGG